MLGLVLFSISADGFLDVIVGGGSLTLSYRFVNIYFGVGPDSLSFEIYTQIQVSGDGQSALSSFDVNADSVSDLLWATRDSTLADQIWISFGGTEFDTIPDLVIEDPGLANFGEQIRNSGDMNGDGYDDIVVTAPSGTITSGFVFVYGAGPSFDIDFDAAVGMSQDSDFGRSASSVSDVNGDGLSDIIVGAPGYDFTTNKGYWGIFLGDSTIQVTEVKEESLLPSAIHLYQSYPNPFNPSTTIRYEINEEASILLEVFTVLGEHIFTLVNEEQTAGLYEVELGASSLSSGVYLYRLSASTFGGQRYTSTRKIVLAK